MKILLDTHIFLWLITNNKRLYPKICDAISNQDNEIYLSVVSVWEAWTVNSPRINDFW